MGYILCLLLILALCSGCGQASAELAPPAEEPKLPIEESAQTAPEDTVLLARDAALADGRKLRLEAVGRVLDDYDCGVREVRVYDGETLLQTVCVREVIEEVWDFGGGILAEDFYDYTQCWTPEQTLEVLDLNFDGNTDFGLFGWCPNNTIPYYCWIWDSETEQYRYAFTLQDVETHPDTQEVTAAYNPGSAAPCGSRSITARTGTAHCIWTG